MKIDLKIRTLISEITQSEAVLKRLTFRLESYEAEHVLDLSPGDEEAMVVSQLLSAYYTCLETVFLRISRYFENNLPSDAWHQTLLDKMTLEIEDIRPAVITRMTRADLLELLKFRHFNRYYFELDYDWEKLRYLLKKFHQADASVHPQLSSFKHYLNQLLD